MRSFIKTILCLIPLAGLILICIGCFAFGAQQGTGESLNTAGAIMFCSGMFSCLVAMCF